MRTDFKGVIKESVLLFLAALMLSMVLNMNSINFIMNQLVRWGNADGWRKRFTEKSEGRLSDL